MLQIRLLRSLKRPATSWLVSVLFYSLTLYPAGDAGAQQARTVSVGPAERSDVVDRIAFVGTLIAKEEVRVNALLQGRQVKQILVEAGAVVSKGQALAVLDAADAQLSLEKNTAQIARASASVAQERSRVAMAAVTESETRKIVDRSRSLVGKGIVSQQVLDEHENAFSRARSQLELAQQSLMVAEAERKLVEWENAEIALMIERSTVRATEAGLILSRSARVGAITSASMEPLFVIAKDGLIELEASVSETSFVSLTQGMRADVRVPGVNRPVEGKVRLTAAQIDPTTRMGIVRLELDQSEALVSGAFVHGHVEVAKRSNVTVPATAVRSQNGTVSVFVVVNDQAILRPITLGSAIGSRVEVLSGLDEDERVVIKAGSFLKPYERILAVMGSGPGGVSTADLFGSVSQ